MRGGSDRRRAGRLSSCCHIRLTLHSRRRYTRRDMTGSLLLLPNRHASFKRQLVSSHTAHRRKPPRNMTYLLWTRNETSTLEWNSVGDAVERQGSHRRKRTAKPS